MSHDNRWTEQAELYALGALETSEAAEFEAHLKGRCRACEERLRLTRDSLTLLASAVPPAVPPAHVKAAVLERVAEDRAPVRGVHPAWKWAWYVFAALAAAFAAFTYYATEDMKREIADVQTELQAQDDTVVMANRAMQYVHSPDVQLIHLEGAIAGRPVKGSLLWNPKTCQGLFLGIGLDRVPNGKAYEFWLIEKGKPLAAGMFVTDSKGRTVFQLPELREPRPFDQFAVTLEPAAGVDQPTGPILLSGTLPAPPAAV